MPAKPGPRPHLLFEANYGQLREAPPTVALLPWGATEAHNYHLPHGTDVLEAEVVAERSAALAAARGCRPIVLPAIPYGNDAMQLDQVATIHISTTTALAILRDVVTSLRRQGITRLLIVNAHGGNEFRPLMRDLILETGSLIVVVDFWKMRPDVLARLFPDPGDHAGDLETSLLLHLRPELVEMERAGPGTALPFYTETMQACAAWTPRPWSRVHPDTGCGDPRAATAAKGAEYLAEITATLADLVVELAGRAA